MSSIFSYSTGNKRVGKKLFNFTRPSLENRGGYFAVLKEDLYYYYRIETCMEVGQDNKETGYLQILYGPPVLVDGLIIISKDEIYKVTCRDLVKGRFKKSLKKITYEPRSIGTGSIDPSLIVSSNGDPSILQHSDNVAISEETTNRILKEADVYLSEQTESLLNPYVEEEEWFAENTTQPG